LNKCVLGNIGRLDEVQFRGVFSAQEEHNLDGHFGIILTGGGCTGLTAVSWPNARDLTNH
jgi:hypothetical protein